MTDWLLKRHTQTCYYYYCYLTFLSTSPELRMVVEGGGREGLVVSQDRDLGGLPGMAAAFTAA